MNAFTKAVQEYRDNTKKQPAQTIKDFADNYEQVMLAGLRPAPCLIHSTTYYDMKNSGWPYIEIDMKDRGMYDFDDHTTSIFAFMADAGDVILMLDHVQSGNLLILFEDDVLRTQFKLSF